MLPRSLLPWSSFFLLNLKQVISCYLHSSQSFCSVLLTQAQLGLISKVQACSVCTKKALCYDVPTQSPITKPEVTILLSVLWQCTSLYFINISPSHNWYVFKQVDVIAKQKVQDKALHFFAADSLPSRLSHHFNLTKQELEHFWPDFLLIFFWPNGSFLSVGGKQKKERKKDHISA